MHIGQTLFAQLMDFLPWKTFHRIVDRYVKSMTCANQFRVIAFAQLTYRESLRDIEVCLSAQSAKLYHMGVRQEAKLSTLADANVLFCLIRKKLDMENLRYPWEGHLSPALANYGKHHRGTTSVGQFPANSFGIFDMLGNVKEWCHDIYSDAAYENRESEMPRDPSGPDQGSFRVFRGGSWMDQAGWIHLSKRGRMYPQNVNPDFGFRCVRKP